MWTPTPADKAESRLKSLAIVEVGMKCVVEMLEQRTRYRSLAFPKFTEMLHHSPRRLCVRCAGTDTPDGLLECGGTESRGYFDFVAHSADLCTDRVSTTRRTIGSGARFIRRCSCSGEEARVREKKKKKKNQNNQKNHSECANQHKHRQQEPNLSG